MCLLRFMASAELPLVCPDFLEEESIMVLIAVNNDIRLYDSVLPVVKLEFHDFNTAITWEQFLSY